MLRPGVLATALAVVLAVTGIVVWQGAAPLQAFGSKTRTDSLELLAQARATTIALDPETRYQTIDSWAVYPRYWEHDKANNRFDGSFAPHAEAISMFLADEVGINGARVEIWSGLENPSDHWSRFYDGRNSYLEDKTHRYEKVNDNDDPFSVDPDGFQFAKFDYRLENMLLPLKRAVEANGERLHINVNYVDFLPHSNQGSLSHAKNPEEFAEFVLVYFERLRDKYGILPDSFEIVLEPDNTRDWRGREIGRALVAVQTRLAANGFTPEFIAPSAARLAKAADYFDEMAEVPGAVEALDTLSYHRYGRHDRDDLLAVRRRAEEQGLKTAMLEKVGAGIDELIEDLTVAQVSSWQQWAVAGLADWGDKGAFYVLADISDPDNLQIMMGRATYHLAQVFGYVHRGAQRIGARSNNPDKRTVAFVNLDGGWVVVVRAKQAGGPVGITGLPAGRYGLRFTGENHEIAHWPEITLAAGQPLAAELPSPGVLTIYTAPEANN